MYLIDEKCVNPNVKGNVCLECSGCGRKFENGHIVGATSCALCKNYDFYMSECMLKEGTHNDMFTRRSDTCDKWLDRNDC